MPKNIRVILVEDDPFARHWMEMLLGRDWRTRVILQVGSPLELTTVFTNPKKSLGRVDLVLIDTDIPQDNNWLPEVLRKLALHSPDTTILLTGVNPNPHVARLLGQSNFAGYILKDEIRYALAWAVILAAERRIVVTPGVRRLFGKTYTFPPRSVMMDGRNSIVNFSERDAQAARLAFIFSMERRDLADELGISEDYSYGLVSTLNKKLGLEELLRGEVNPDDHFGTHPALKPHLKRALEHVKNTTSKKTRDQETLAFHMLTLPDIIDLS